MTEQEVRQFFLRLKGKRALRRSLISEQAKATEDLCQIRAVDYEKPRVSGTSDMDISKMLVAAEDRNRIRAQRLAALMQEIEEESEKAYNMISLCDNDLQKSILIDRWMQDTPWDEMEKRHHYSRKQLWRIMLCGVAAIAKGYKEHVDT